LFTKVYATTPDPIIEYQLGAELQGVYQPKAFANCWVTSMGNANFYIGPFIPDSNTHLTVVRFLSRQSPVGMGRYAKCEAPTSVSAEQRAEWLMARDSSIVRSKVRIFYVDGVWDQVTLTVTPSHSPTNTSSPTRTNTLTPSLTPTPIPAPPPTLVFYTGDSIDTLQYYAPKKNNICITWNDLIGRIGPYFLPRGKSPIIIKFLEDQVTQPMVVVWCEEAPNHTPAERLSYIIADQPCCYSWNQGILMYVGTNMQVVTLTTTPTITTTPMTTSTSTPTSTVTNTSTAIATETETSTLTSTVTSTSSRTSTRTPTRTSSSTRTNTPTVTPVLAPDKVVPGNVSTLHIPKAGHICFGQVIGDVRNSLVEFVSDYSTGIEISGGGCFTKKYYSLSQVMRYIESRGVRYGYLSLPRPTLTPSKTIPPTVTIVRYLAIGMQTDGVKDVILDPGTVCWGKKVGTHEYKVVRFQKGLTTSTRIIVGGCTVGQNLSAEDVFNFLRRVYNTPLNGFVEVK
jgi:hypothetical protein